MDMATIDTLQDVAVGTRPKTERKKKNGKSMGENKKKKEKNETRFLWW